MDTLLAATQAPTFCEWLCIAVIACAATMPKGLIAMDRMLARRPERSEWSACSYVPDPRGATQPSIWPRVMTAIRRRVLDRRVAHAGVFMPATRSIDLS